jgi:MFS transporter, DHA3 family, macrolide efflux protein
MTTVAATVPLHVRPAASRLVNRNFLLLWQAQLVSQFGNQAFSIAITFWTASATHSATMTGLVLMASVLPVVVLGPVAGALVDRWRSPLRVVVACDLASGFVVTAFGLGLVGRPDAMQPSLLLAIALIVGVSSAFLEPALSALVPDLVPANHLEGANAFRQSSRQVTVLTAQAIGGILYVVVGPAMLFLIDGLSFLFAAASELAIDSPSSGRDSDTAHDAPRRALAKDAADGLRYVRAQHGMMAFLIAVAVFNALLMPVSVLLPVYASAYLGGGAQWYGFLLAAISAGAFAGCALAGAVPAAGATRRRILVGAFATLALGLAALGAIRTPIVALVVIGATGLCAGIVNVLVMSTLQRRTPANLRGRVLGLHLTLTRALVPIATLGGGVIADLTGRNVPLVFGVCGALALASVMLLVARANTRQYLDGTV